MSTVIRQMWQHRHACPRKDEIVTVRPEVRNGIWFERVPKCAEEGLNFGSHLFLIETKTDS